ncbi:MAG: aldose 1-epimerase [Spirochaetales bacterium]|nr:aldose 1-epimerase [Spirochaetales bacterium]
MIWTSGSIEELDIGQIFRYDVTIMITLANTLSTVVVDPEMGLTVESFTWNGEELIHHDPARKEAGRTYGIPILFPTPNRVANDRYAFNGNVVPAVMHGFLRHRAFHIESGSDTHVAGRIIFDGSEPLFPYDAEVLVTLSLIGSTLRWEFHVMNTGDEPFAYGLAIHPFFVKKNGMTLEINAHRRLVTDEHMLPTEEVVEERLSSDVDSLSIDGIFKTNGPSASTLRGDGVALKIQGGPAFGYTVVYTDAELPFITVEPQSCAINAHNLVNRELAALQILESGKERQHWIEIRVEPVMEHAHAGRRTTESGKSSQE